MQQMNRNIELIRYRRFGERLLMLELVNSISAETKAPAGNTGGAVTANQKTIATGLAGLEGSLQDLYQALRAYVTALGDDVQEKTLKYYVAFKRLRNFACVEVHPNKATLSVYLKVNPDTTTLEPGFSRDVRKTGHYGTGDLEVTIRTQEDLEKAKPLLQASYEDN